MRTMLVITAIFSGAFLIVGLTASTLENWASARRNADQASLIEGPRSMERSPAFREVAAALPSR